MPESRRFAVAWNKDGADREFAEVVLTDERLSATGVAMGSQPEEYQLNFSLQTGPSFVTAHLRLLCVSQGWKRGLDVRRSADGAWSIGAQEDAPQPAVDVAQLADVLDVDVGLSPLTNTPPVLRGGLLQGGVLELNALWVAVPELTLSLVKQRYSFVERRGDGAIVRYEDESGFSADLLFDADGFVRDYPGLATRVQ